MRVMILDGHPYEDVEGSSIPTNKELYGAKKRKQGFLIIIRKPCLRFLAP